jgi:methionine-rich copper-binding protein CopC
MMLHFPFRRASLLILAASFAALAFPGLALADTELKTASPADKSTATTPVEVVSGTFTEPLKADGSSLVVKDAAGATVAKGTVDAADAKLMIATPATPLDNGTYAVAWTAIAADGHVNRGKWSFTVAVAPTAAPTPIATAAPTAQPSAAPTTAPIASPTSVAVTHAPSIAPTPAPSADGGMTGSGADAVLPIIVALIVLGAGAAYLLTRRNRPTDPA